MNTYEVTYEGCVYNHDKLANIFEETITVSAKSSDIEDIQEAVEQHDERTYGSFTVIQLTEVVKNYTPTFIISPKTTKTSANDRRVIREALSALIEKHGQRLNRLVREDKIEEAADAIARARDLFTRFEG